jgi:hypothetical protein
MAFDLHNVATAAGGNFLEQVASELGIDESDIALCLKGQCRDHEIVHGISHLHWRSCHDGHGGRARPDPVDEVHQNEKLGVIAGFSTRSITSRPGGISGSLLARPLPLRARTGASMNHP